ncbi:LLM class flavin-dependent oxidoreductase [Rhodococcus pyridinivorans]|uniref:LLM class flavin-dependent oxidoreductase n=1 Tax=Rhodococcus pyridinivorans TaxID=103816 RepID=UPI0039B66356
MSQTIPASDQIADGTAQRSDSPVFTSPNKMKLGVFATNLSGTASGMSTLKGPMTVANWSQQAELAITADRAGIEALVPASRWKGFGSASGYWDRTYDTWTWGGAMAAITERIQVFTTCAVPLYHPVMAAKMGATLDHVSGGRWGVNIVPGWFGSEFEQFGMEMGDRKARYRLAQEWFTLVNRLWTEADPIDFEGEFYKIKGAVSAPKPVQMPRPLVMNAGQSEEGLGFATRNADMIFVNTTNEEVLTKNIAKVRADAEASGKQVSIWANMDIICKSTEQEARDLADAWMEAVDTEAVDKFISLMAGGDAGTHKTLMQNPDIWKSMALTGGNAFVIGTPEMVVEKFQQLSDLGMDGTTMTWHEYPQGLNQFVSDVLPLMREAGLRDDKPLDS